MQEYETESFSMLLVAARTDTRLTLGTAGLTSEELRQILTHLQQNTRIQHLGFAAPLKLQDSTVTKMFTDAISSLSSLKTLYFHGVELLEADACYLAEALGHHRSITEFYFTEKKRVNHAAVFAILTGISTNQSIDLLHFDVMATDSSIAYAFADMLQNRQTSLKTLFYGDSFSKSQSHDGMAKLVEHLQLHSKLAFFDLTDCRLNDIAVQQLARIINTSQCLDAINLRGCAIGPHNGVTIANALLKNRFIYHLNLSFNQLGTEGLLAFTEVVKQNTVLRYLHLDWNRREKPTQLAASGTLIAQKFAEALKENQMLTSFTLIGNEIDDEGAIALANALTTQTSLKHLQLNGNPIGDPGCLAILAALKSNQQLESLYLSNEVSRSTLQEFVKAYQQNLISKTNIHLAYRDLSVRLNQLDLVYTAVERAFIQSMLTLQVLQQTDNSCLATLPDEIVLHIATYIKPPKIEEIGSNRWLNISGQNGRESLEKILAYAKHLLSCANCQTLDFATECQTRHRYVNIETELLIYKFLQAIKISVSTPSSTHRVRGIRKNYSTVANFHGFFKSRHDAVSTGEEHNPHKRQRCCVM